MRVLSAALLGPPVAAALLLGSPYSELLVSIAGAVMAWEWARLCTGRRSVAFVGGLAIAAVVGAVAAASLGLFQLGGWIVAAGTVAALIAEMGRRPAAALWLAFGIVYLAAACTAFLWLRQLPESGLPLIIWLVATVWATDTGAFAVGRTVGGPRLAPRLSPGKTWAGLLGAGVAAAVVGLVCVAVTDVPLLRATGAHRWAVAAAASVLVALVAQVGDLLESALKRRFGAKDASHIIPGHGGLLDRVDGLLAASLALAAGVRLSGLSA